MWERLMQRFNIGQTMRDQGQGFYNLFLGLNYMFADETGCSPAFPCLAVQAGENRELCGTANEVILENRKRALMPKGRTYSN